MDNSPNDRKRDNKKRLREEYDRKMQRTYIRNWVIAIVSLALALAFSRMS